MNLVKGRFFDVEDLIRQDNKIPRLKLFKVRRIIGCSQ